MNTQEKNIFLAKLSLIILITGIIVSILSFLINNVIGLIIISLSLIFSLILGIISWNEKMSKIIVIISSIIITILILISAFMFFSFEPQNNIRKNDALGKKNIQQLRNNNCLVEYLAQSEIQYETDKQKYNIINALNDILTLSIDELKNKKYPNYIGEENQWDLPTLISKYFIPVRKNLTLGDNFYTNIRRKEVQEIIKDLIVNLKVNNKKEEVKNLGTY